MKKLLLLSLLFTLYFSGKTLAQIATWDFTGQTTLPTSTATSSDPGLASVPVLTRGAGAVASAGNNSFRTVGFQNNGISIANTDYFQVTLTASAGNKISLSSLDALFAGTATYYATTGVSSQYAYSLDGTTFTLIGAPTAITSTTVAPNASPTVSLSGISALQNVAAGTTITIRYYASGQTATGGWGFNSPATGRIGFSIGGSVATSGTVDITPPTNATGYPKTASITSTTVNLISNINEAGNTYYIIIPATGTAPTTSAQIKAGRDGNNAAAFKFGTIANLANTDATATISGLTLSTAYKIYAVSEDLATTPNLQTVFTTLNFSTLGSADITPPVTAATYPKASNATLNSINFTNNINEAGTTYYVLLPSGSTAPTPAQVKAGFDATGVAAPKAGSLTNVANADATATISGLTSGTTYTLYIIAQDNTGNLQTAVANLDVTTANPPLVSAPIIISQYYEGTSVNKWIELTNLSNAPINTASPQLKLALYNISGDAGNINITGAPSQIVNLNFTIPARGSVLLGNTGNSNSEVPYLTTASAVLNSNTVINFNGNDGVALLDANNNIIDAFGQGVNAKDVSYVRSLNVTAPSPTYIDDDWTRTILATVQNAIDDDDVNRLGVHFPPNLPVCAAPSSPATALVFSSVTTNSISASFTKSADANEYLIIRSLNTTLTALPIDGTVYSVGSAFGGGIVANRIVTNTFTDNALADATSYSYFIIPLNNISCTGGPKYLTTNILTARQATKALLPCAISTAQPTSFTVTSSNYNFIQGSFTPSSSADEYLVVMSTTNTLSSAPVNQTTYSVGDQLGGGIVVKRGTGNTFIRNGLSQNTNYYFFIYSINSACSGGPLYLTTQPLLGNLKTGILDVNKLNFYYGNLHSHSSYSDGNKDDLTKKPEDDYAFAKNSMNLDFLGISEHNHTQAGMSLASWQPGIDAAKKATTSTFVAMHGMEWGVISGGGHVIVYGIDSLIGWESGENQIYVPKSVYTGTTGLFRIINRHGLNAVATLAHPNTTDYNNISATYDLSADSAIVGTALESGPAFSTNVTYSDPASSMSYLSYYNRMLARGYHLGASIDHDNHNLTFGRHTRARLVVLAPALTENDLLDAIKKMRFYASQDSAAKIVFTINKQPVGSIFKTAGAPIIEVNSITTSPVTSIKILYGTPGSGTNPVELTAGASTSLTYTDNALTNLATGYYYADIVEADGSRIITSPIWYTRDDAVVKKAQNITFASTRTATYGDADLPAGATSDNTNINITYTSSDTNVATISNTDIHIVKVGTVTITANQPGDTFYNPAVAKQQVLTINPKTINITADAKTKIEGTVDPPLTYTSTPALIGTDTFSGALVRVAGETGGDYAINQGTLAINANYAINYRSANFHITPKPVASIAGNTAICINSTSPTITFTGTKGTAPYTFTYNINGGTSRTVSTTGTNTTATVSASTNVVGNYVYNLVSVADVNTSQAQTGTATVIINPLPVVSINSNKGISISKGDAIILTATGGNQYSWTGSEIISGQTTAAVTIRPKQTGSYKVTVTNASGCSIDQTINISVIDDYKLDASSVVTPNGDGINDKFIIKNIDYYPNNTLKIFDKAGRVLYTKHTYANDWDGTINGSPLSEGTYYYILDLGSNLGNFKGFINIIRD
ncbi:gliding motility-associated C-terminal domain-containing protein [Pedobacter fastidiosus]|uniref:CehA/McbA family metallohydrolase n=1 Tax=Pedobacter fastidiosus TaxID=2765361 RepID=A0ABR7KV64_9SPHI|nr:gliding motility-associated C-terminal domain-containing protein [Pedobacter fastidiosus]MBC6111925.1 CehA/McbA family metallohydrolase [Pedobacter fastidiosus]